MAQDSKLVVFLKLDGTDLGKGISKAQKDVTTLGVAFSGVGLAAAAAVKMTANFQDTTIKAARAAGMASQQFSAMAYAAGLSGVSTEALGKSMVKLQNPTGMVNQTLIDLGISAKDASGKVKDQTTLMGELADKFEKIQDPATKSQAAFRIFGEEGVKMVSLLESGKQGLADMAKEAQAFGQTVSEKAGKAAELFNDNLTRTEKGISGFRNALSETAIEMANSSGIVDTINGKLKDLIEWWRGLDQSTKEMTIKVLGAAAALGGLLLVFSGLAAALPALSAGFALLTGPIGIVGAAIGGLTLGFSEYRKAAEKSAEAQQIWVGMAGGVGSAIQGMSLAYDMLADRAGAAGRSIDSALASASKFAGDSLEKMKVKSPKIKVKLSDTVKPAEVMFKNETLEAINDIKRARWAATGANVEQMERLNKMLAKQDKAFYSVGQQAAIAYAKVAESVAKTAQQIIKPFGDLTSAIADGIAYDAQVADRDLEAIANKATEAYTKQREELEATEAAKIAALEQSYDTQIEALENAEAQKYDILEKAANERLLLADSEYQRARDAAEAAFQAQLAQDQLDYELKTEQLEAQAIDREQRKLTETIMEEDARILRERREQEHADLLAKIARDHADKTKAIDADLKAQQKLATETNKAEIEALTFAKNDALSKAEDEKNAKLKAMDEKRASEEKAIEKQRLETQYKAQLDAFNATKGIKIAETIASGAAAAAQAFNAMVAAVPFIGVGLGAAVAGVILATTAMRVGQISSQQPVKPAGLLEDGGYIAGSGRHANGTDYAARIESDEFTIDRGRTAKMLKAIDSGITGGGIQITFQPGAIQGDIRDDRTLNMIAVKMGQLIQRQMVTA